MCLFGTPSRFGVMMSLQKSLFAWKRSLLFPPNTCRFLRRQLWCLCLNCGKFAEDLIQRVESFNSIAGSSLFTQGNWKINARPSKRPQHLLDCRGGSQGGRDEKDTVNGSARHFGNKFGEKQRSGNESLNSEGHEGRKRFHYHRHWSLCSFSP